MMIGLYYMRLLRCGCCLREPPTPDDNLPPFLNFYPCRTTTAPSVLPFCMYDDAVAAGALTHLFFKHTHT